MVTFGTIKNREKITITRIHFFISSLSGGVKLTRIRSVYPHKKSRLFHYLHPGLPTCKSETPGRQHQLQSDGS